VKTAIAIRLLLALFFVILVRGAASAQSAAEVFSRELAEIRWVAYAPTNFHPEASPPVPPSRASVTADLELLRRHGCDGLVTYSASLPEVVEIAARLGFRGVLLGVWDPASAEELATARRLAALPVVKGIIVGNEGLMFRRYDLPTLGRAMRSLRRATGKPVSTTEVVESYYTEPELIAWSDFLAPNVHPFFHEQRDPTAAAAWTTAVWQRLRQHLPAGFPVLFKEVGLPSAGQAGLSEAAQAEYYRQLALTPVRYVYFEAFDAAFKQGAVEQSWGFFRADRAPKPAAAVLCAGHP
jgi:exo-beta-1,3-glucanase (GH17 family)